MLLTKTFTHLSTLEGTLTREWDTVEELRADLDDEEGQDDYLLGTFAMAADRRGVTLGPEQVYVFVPPPMIAGQLHAPGT